MAARLIAVPSAAELLTGAAPAPGSQPWLLAGLVFFGVAAVGMLAAVGIKMRRTPKPPQQRPPAPSAPAADGWPDAEPGPGESDEGEADPDDAPGPEDPAR
ncbi:hypothetical protein ACI2IX_14735 [Leifsonia aquatica]|uniref:hypothetical protein n=1 Tax=Leifsonia aquatica TaxID=144185 RepID=UPI00384BB43E